MFLILFISVVVVILIAFKPANSVNIDVGDFKYGGGEEGEVVQPVHLTDILAPIPPYPPFNRYSLDRGVEEAVKTLGKAPMLPEWLPEGMRYAEVYTGPPVVIICFSDRAIKDFRYANVSIEVSVDNNPPSLETLRTLEESWREQGSDHKLVQVGDLWIVLCEKASPGPDRAKIFGPSPSPLAWFWKDNLYYIVGVGQPLTTQDLLKIIESMNPS